jgi:hypothetical protein
MRSDSISKPIEKAWCIELRTANLRRLRCDLGTHTFEKAPQRIGMKLINAVLH